jgi:hypothetical protein
VASAALSLAQELEMDRARIAAALERIYRAAGFPAAVEIHQGVMRSLVERARAEGAETGGWIA